ncbi:MAG: ATP F0F1 synthase subunit B [Rhizobiales bacterium]|nr:ATP F0F1 synthase subunit B [Hyphomicrobiales bacterium]
MSQSTTATTVEFQVAEETAPAAATGGEAAGGEAHGTTEGTEAHGGGHQAVFPPLDTKTYPSQLFWLLIFFAALYVLMSKVVLPRISAILAKRKATIDSDLARAQALKDETEAAVKAYEKALADARANATEIARTTREAVTRDVDAESHKLDEALAQKVTAAEAKIAASKAKALDAVEDIAADSAVEIVAALGGGKVTKAAVAKAIKG